MRRILRTVRILLLAVAATAGNWAGPAQAEKVDPAVLDAQRLRTATIERLAPAVVAVFQRSTAGGGSGVLISRDGYAITNYHVVGEDQFFKCGLNDGNLYDAVLVGVDPTGDVALIKLVGRDDFPTAVWGDSDALHVGDWVYVLGNPFLLASDFQPTATYGIVSGVHRYQYPANTILEYTDCLQVDASVNPGNSGGPLFNHSGELVGINGRISIAQRGRVNAGAGYAISINQIRNFLGCLRSGRISDHASLGATVTTDSHGGVVVSEILEESDAYRRGLRTDDEILSFAGRSIHSVNQFKNILGILPEQWRVPLTFRRTNEKHDIRVRLRPLHSKMEFEALAGAEPEKPRARPMPQGPQRRRDKTPEKRPNPRRTFAAPPEARVPDQLKTLYVAKPGFANFHFNGVERARVLRGLETFRDARRLRKWILSGTNATGGPFELTLSDPFASLEMGGKAYLQQADQEPQDEPAGTGGLLVALNQLRMFLTRQEKAFPSLVYFGTEPLDAGKAQVDVLLSSLGSVESRWYFSVATGALVGFDTRLDDADPCEIRFREMGTIDGIRFPTEILVRHGDADYALFRVQRLRERS